MEAAAAAAETVQTSYPAFVKPMVRSHVSSCFWLGLPKSFCQQHMPNVDTSFLLEDDEGVEWECLYLAHKTGLSGGWRGFALAHNLEDGDAIVFERVKPTKFKLHIVRAFDFEQAEPVKQPPAKKQTKKNKVNNKLPFQPEGSELQRKVTGATVSRESIKKEHARKLERAEFTMERGKSARLNGRARVKSEKTTNKSKLQAQYKSLDTKVKAEAKNGIQQENVDARAGRLIRRTKSLIASQ
ncbi:hypothetical protein O6H91_02G140900 [Diphasiastrum complanatum]|nr:hypothetical protein O6H91_02G140900 [Diphasiastrum complanatum]